MTQDAAGTLEGRVREYLRERGLEPRTDRVTALTPDASTRRYMRVTLTDGGSIVLAVYPDAMTYADMPFSGVAALLGRMALPIPAVLGHSDPLGIVALEDLGDVTLQAHLTHAGPVERLARYREAIGLITQIQQRGAEFAGEPYPPYGLAFDREKLTWELDFFLTHFLEAYRRAAIPPAARERFAHEWRAIADELAAEPRVVCHRDFHSRNLMVHDGRLYIIDFQDARLGPDTYDLVSLLRDAYVEIGDEEREGLIDGFVARRAQPVVNGFRRRFDLMSVQRNLKALGTFGYQATARSNATYIPYMDRTLRYVRTTIHAHERFAGLRDLLAEHLTELR